MNCVSRGTALALAILILSAPSAAQTATDAGRGLLLGPVTLRPAFVLREAGVDSNVFNQPGDAQEDRTAALSGSTDASMRLGLVQINGSGGAEYLYFERFTSERGVNRFATVRLQPDLFRLRPFVAAGYKRTRDRATSEIDVRAPRIEYDYTGGLEARISTRASLKASMQRVSWRFDEGEQFRDVDLAARLNRTGDKTEIALSYELSPLTTFLLSTNFVRERFVESSEYDNDSLQAEAGLTFAPDAIVRGRAMVGLRDIRPHGERSAPSRGPTASIELSYTLLERTIFAGRFRHERMVSVESHPFYLSTANGIEVTHRLVGPLEVIARADRERLEYEELAAFNLPPHTDHVDTAGGGVALRLGKRTRIVGNYDRQRRRSDALFARDYDRRRIYTTISYGF